MATFRVFSSSHRPMSAPTGAHSAAGAPPPPRKYWMAATTVTEGPLILSRLASNEINYLQVNNFTRAIMPRSKIWRVSKTELVIPASHTNYWLITLQGPEIFIAQLDQILRGLCKYELSSVDSQDIEFYLDEELLTTSCAKFWEATELDIVRNSRKRSDVVFGSILYDYEEVQPRESDRESLASRAKRTISLGNAKTVLSESISNDPPSRKQALSSSDTLSRMLKSPARSAPTQRISVLDSPESAHEKDEVKSRSYASSPLSVIALSTPPSSPEQPLMTPFPRNTTSSRERHEMPKKEIEKLIPSSKQVLTQIPLVMETPVETSSMIPEDQMQQSTRKLQQNNVTPSSNAVSEHHSCSSHSKSPMLAPQSEDNSTENNAQTPKDPEKSPEKPLLSLEPKFEPRFSHPLIPSSHVSRYYPTNPCNGSLIRPRVSLQRRDLTTLGPSTLHPDVTTVGGYIGMKAVKGLLRRT